MSTASRLLSLAQSVGADVKSLRTWISGSASGDLTGLTTTDKSSIIAAINELKAFTGKMYPVGCIYMSVNATNPGTTLGFGTWVAWGAGRVPVGVDGSDSDFSSVELTGGEKTVTLTAAQIPAHTHPATSSNAEVPAMAGTTDRTATASTGADVAMDAGTAGVSIIIQGSNHKHTVTVSANTGGGGSHNNLQPFITCYMWKRTA